MHVRKIDETLSVSAQITADDVAEAARLGFRAIIANRPDGEEPGQPDQAEIASAAEAAGLAFRYLPVTPGTMSDELADGMADALRALPRPVLAYCRSGARSATLHAMAMAR